MVIPYLNFSGRCGEALDFYERVFDAQDKQVMRYKDAPPNPAFPVPKEMEDYVLHAEMTICGTRMSFSDTQRGAVQGDMISLAVDFSTPEEVTGVFHKLKEGGEVLMDLAPQFFSPMYAMVKDKFGISWQIICR